jgi:quercetin dioxygenase-like cupin family protein
MGKYVIKPGDRPAYEPPGHVGTINYPLLDPANGAEHLEVALGVISEAGEVHPHAHEKEEQAMYILEGKASIDVEGVKEVAGPGDFVFFPRGKTHEIVVLEFPYRVLVIYAPPRES